MKKILISLTAILLSIHCLAQEQLAFPFQGGKEVMTAFFKDSLTVSPEIVQKRATGVVIFKFTADTKGGITKLVVYYADDAILIPPVIDAIKKSNHKWIIPDHEKFHDFILQFAVSFNPLASPVKGLQTIIPRSIAAGLVLFVLIQRRTKKIKTEKSFRPQAILPGPRFCQAFTRF